MEILAHTLWAAAGAHGANKVFKKRLRVRWAMFWGVFPDLFAFTVLILWYGVQLFFYDVGARSLPEPSSLEPIGPDSHWIFHLTTWFYALSHSAIVFFVIVGLVFLIQRRVVWEMGGWLFHILIDVATHSYATYPTPVLWPVSSWRFDGIPWALPWFIVLNYTMLFVVYIWMAKGEHVRAAKFAFARSYEKFRGFRRYLYPWSREEV